MSNQELLSSNADEKRPTNNPERPFVLVVGADFTPAGDIALDQAARMAARIPGCDLRVIQVVEPGTSEARITQLGSELGTYVNEICAALGIHLTNVGIHVRPGAPEHQIAVLAAELEADVIVVGMSRPADLKGFFLGSVADRVMRIAACPVLVASRKHETAEVHAPVIEPLCKDCEGVRALSADTQQWCARHGEHHVHGHTYTYHRELPFAQHDSSVLPTGVASSSRRAL